MRKKVLIIGIDGASPDIIQKAIQKCRMSFLKEIIGENKNDILKLKSTIPSSTAPAWTSAMTGVNPGKHGIYDFLIHKGINSRPTRYSDVKKSFIWDILSRYDLKSVVIGHPTTYPVKNDDNIVMISGLLAPKLNEKSVYPIDVLDILNAENYSIDIEDKMPLLKSDPYKAVEICNESAINRLKVSKKIFKNYEWNFGFILFPESDRLLHYHISKENHVLKHFEILDKVIRDLTSIEDDVIIFVISDHGFVKISKVFAVNSFLHNLSFCNMVRDNKRNFILKFAKKIAMSRVASVLLRLGLTGSKLGAIAEGQILKEISKAWFTPYAESGIRLNPNLSNYEREKIVNMLLNILNNLKDPLTGDRIVRAHKREDIYWGEEMYTAPEIVLIPQKNYMATHVIPTNLNKVLFNPNELFLKEGDHVCEYSQYGILAVSGFKIGFNKNVYSIMDIAPTILDIFKIPIDKYYYMDGHSLLSNGGKLC